MSNTAQTPERIQNLRYSLEILNKAEIHKLTPQKRSLVLSGFCLGKWSEDIIYQMSYQFGRDLIIEIEEFLNKQDNEQ